MRRNSLIGVHNDTSCSLVMRSNNIVYHIIIDLPNLTTLDSDSDSFEYPRIVILEGRVCTEVIIFRYT